MEEKKCVIIVNENLPVGQLANTTAILAASIGKKHPELIGYNLEDNDGHMHSGITTLPIPILKGGKILPKLRSAIRSHEDFLTIIDLIEATSTTRSYEEYALAMKNTPMHEYYGIAIYGPTRFVKKYSGSLGLLR